MSHSSLLESTLQMRSNRNCQGRALKLREWFECRIQPLGTPRRLSVAIFEIRSRKKVMGENTLNFETKLRKNVSPAKFFLNKKTDSTIAFVDRSIRPVLQKSSRERASDDIKIFRI